jgi:protein-S-isoprenylcysteine O-methyltransferase Ste14
MPSWRFAAPEIAWLALLVYWLVMAFDVKVAARTETPLSRFGHLGPLFVAGTLMAYPLPRELDMLNQRLFPFTLPVLVVGDVLLIAGVATAIWARRTLGRNWSANVMQKTGHELIEGGPFRFVRHPIYTGFLLAMIGTTLLIDEWRAVLATVITFLAFWRKYRLEERFMVELFGDKYFAYRTRVPALVPRMTRQR